MSNNRNIKNIFPTQPQGTRLKEGPRNRWWNDVSQDWEDVKDITECRFQKIVKCGRGPRGRRRSLLECNADKEVIVVLQEEEE